MIETPRRQRHPAAMIGLLVLVACASTPRGDDSSGYGGAAIVDVRVGRHQGFTRVVLETDGPAGFRIDPTQTGELLVHLEASATRKSLPGTGPVLESIEVEPSEAETTLRLALQQPRVKLRHQVVGDPPRLILDLRDPPSSELTARGARVADVRVGVHDGFTRLVIETDSPSPYRIERAGEREIAVHVEARGIPKRLPAGGPLFESVRLEAEGAVSAARVRLRSEAVSVRHSTLEDPPRIVLDFRDPGPVAIAGSAPKP